MILPLAVLTQLAAVCAPQVAPSTLAAIARVESGSDSLAIGDDTTHRILRPAKYGGRGHDGTAAARRGA